MNLKNELIKTLSHKISISNRILRKKELLKQSQKEVIYEYILTFAGWWWMVEDMFWLVVGIGEWWRIYFGWWWVVVDGDTTAIITALYVIKASIRQTFYLEKAESKASKLSISSEETQ